MFFVDDTRINPFRRDVVTLQESLLAHAVCNFAARRRTSRAAFLKRLVGFLDPRLDLIILHHHGDEKVRRPFVANQRDGEDAPDSFRFEAVVEIGDEVKLLQRG